ncbi:Lecithin:cholesterol/phospholipid:diacylglycerol acyltransferase [Macleaya cordata]|uniref:Lecithin:cholesterol/phospholipid:diacylglycerol acyltransferase n=1 Tax=Macleaya cordata TaxID=56857 RepID=A0A200QDR1_MACCD|nr:Lecithin:cholesterol/phospholipid:diacylglycerol acyltransferase [Macleaya cordata]
MLCVLRIVGSYGNLDVRGARFLQCHVNSAEEAEGLAALEAVIQKKAIFSSKKEEMKRLGLVLEVVVVVWMAVMVYMCHARSDLHPLILVPGSGGNQLEARLTKDYKPSSLICRIWSRPGGRWFRLWFDTTVLIAPFTECFADRMTLHYDPVKDDYQNAPGVETRDDQTGWKCGTMNWNLDWIGILDHSYDLLHITAYMAPLVESLEQQGYIEGQNLFGAPYDFRYGLAAEGHPSAVGTKYLQQLKELIEKASNSNGGKPVIILSHSLGGLFVLHFLNRNLISWRRKFVKHFVALSAPWGGTVQEMLTFASGYSLGVPLVDPLLVRDEQRSSESNLWLLPAPKLFGHQLPLVITPETTYSAFDIPRFLDDIGFPEGVEPYKNRTLPLTERLVAPKVPITCIIGTGVKTPETLFYGKDGFEKQPEIVYGDGDGTVNLVSLLRLESEWADDYDQEAKELLKVIKIPGVSHTSVLQDDVALERTMEEISVINSHVLISSSSVLA